MSFLMDKNLTKFVDQAFETARLGRNGVHTARELVNVLIGPSTCEGVLRLEPEPFAAIILCTSDPEKADDRTRSGGRAFCDIGIGPTSVTLTTLPQFQL